MNSTRVRVTVVDDDKLQRWSMREKLMASGDYEVEMFETAEAALESLNPESIDVLLLDIRLPGMDGVSALKEIRKRDAHLPVIMTTADDQTSMVVDCMRSGASDYICKPFDFDRLQLILRRAWESVRLRREVALLRREGEERHLSTLVGSSPKMLELRDSIARIARSSASMVLLQGENGTGKDLVAKAIHGCSDRREGPFIAINCAAIPETLIESELFGHERGAFTDAKTMRRGLLELANGGTLMLDEIGDMPLAMQARLLRVLEDRRFRRLGGGQDLSTDIRLIAATNRDLERGVAEGSFRQDLLYRLKVIPLLIPPLRTRREDIPLLSEYFVAHYNVEFHRNVRGISSEAMEILLRYAWPGNVRELRNVIERAIILGSDEPIGLEGLPAELQSGNAVSTAQVSGLFSLPASGISLQEVEKGFVKQALAMSANNQTRAARLLGLERDALRRRMEKYGLT